MGGYSQEQARELAALSFGINRQIGLIIDRQGRPQMVIVGDNKGIFITDLARTRQGTGRLRGLRLLHTHLGSEGLSQEDLMDMVFLRLDSVAALSVGPDGRPAVLNAAHLLPDNEDHKAYRVLEPAPWNEVDLDFTALAEALEDELARTHRTVDAGAAQGCALLVGVGTEPKSVQEIELDELADLARTAGLKTVGRLVQRVPKINPKFILGKGKVADLEVLALQTDAQIIVFNRELSPGQLRNLADVTERKILDRTQLILDIFAQHATTRAGKLQVEMAQLKYTLPRLVGQNRALSRLMGGIGGRGPGETKLELDRRKIRDRIARIKQDLDQLRRRRGYTRARRAKAGLPVVALVGYTNAGKSTLLNTLTHSHVLTENKLFATLDPTSRRLRVPKEREIVLTDTVGFIRELPEELKEAFRATLEELESADVLVQVADASHPELEHQVMAVNEILREMNMGDIPRILALNKWDLVNREQHDLVKNIFPRGIPVSAPARDTLDPLVEEIIRCLPCRADSPITDVVA